MNRKTEQSNKETNSPLSQGQSVSTNRKYVLSELCDQNLQNQNDEENWHKHVVFEKSFKNIDFIVYHSCIDHVKDL